MVFFSDYVCVGNVVIMVIEFYFGGVGIGGLGKELVIKVDIEDRGVVFFYGGSNVFYGDIKNSWVIRIVGYEEIVVFFVSGCNNVMVLGVDYDFNIVFEEVVELVVFYIDIDI